MTSWPEMTKFSKRIHEHLFKSIFFGPAGGSAPGKVLRSTNVQHMACRDGDGFRTRRAILYSTKLGQIVAKRANGFCENYFTKIKISRPILGRFCWELYQLKLRGRGLRFWEREVQEKSVAREQGDLRSAKCTKLLSCRFVCWHFLKFWRPCGGLSTWKGDSPPRMIAYGL